MNKLLINSKDKKRFQDIFAFLFHNHCQVYLTPQGIDFRNDKTQGSIYKDAFIDFQVQGTKHINLIQDSRFFKQWLKNWKEIENCVEIGL